MPDMNLAVSIQQIESKRSPAHVAQAVEHFLGKEKVPGSNPGVGSKVLLRLDFVFVSRRLEGDGRLTGNDRETDQNMPSQKVCLWSLAQMEVTMRTFGTLRAISGALDLGMGHVID